MQGNLSKLNNIGSINLSQIRFLKIPTDGAIFFPKGSNLAQIGNSRLLPVLPPDVPRGFPHRYSSLNQKMGLSTIVFDENRDSYPTSQAWQNRIIKIYQNISFITFRAFFILPNNFSSIIQARWQLFANHKAIASLMFGFIQRVIGKFNQLFP